MYSCFSQILICVTIWGLRPQSKALPLQVEFLTTDRVLTKFYERFVLGEKSKYIDDDGNVIKNPGAQYDENGVRALY